MRVIINADDFGYSEETVRATAECFEQGALTSASIMAGMPAAGEALAFAGRHPEFSFGVHLTLAGEGLERPLSDPGEVPGLVDGEGRFLPTNRVRVGALLRRLPRDQIERELGAQLALVADHGIAISHADSHGHVHKLPLLQDILAGILPRFGVERVRSVQDVYLTRPLTSATYWFGAVWQRRIKARFRTTDHFYMPASDAGAAWEGLDPGSLGGGSLEIGVHPGFEEAWRDEERRGAVRLAERLRAGGHELIGWRAL